ncbi:MAG: hypothetical protein Q7S55_03085 [Nanoarchaeota archaeon]|nr:hypothetical protein [Nanoarchaeota archaeon]
MIKHKIAVLLVIIAIISLLTGCEKLTASMDGVDKEGTTESSEVVPEAVTGQPETEESYSDALTGGSIVEDEEPSVTTHTVKMTADGFSPDKLYIKVGDTVVWENTRSGSINKAMIIGVRECSEIRSGFLKPGESFSWTFDKHITCTFADGIMTMEESKVYVE